MVSPLHLSGKAAAADSCCWSKGVWSDEAVEQQDDGLCGEDVVLRFITEHKVRILLSSLVLVVPSSSFKFVCAVMAVQASDPLQQHKTLSHPRVWGFAFFFEFADCVLQLFCRNLCYTSVVIHFMFKVIFLVVLIKSFAELPEDVGNSFSRCDAFFSVVLDFCGEYFLL